MVPITLRGPGKSRVHGKSMILRVHPKSVTPRTHGGKSMALRVNGKSRGVFYDRV